jgi:hypothetical protein
LFFVGFYANCFLHGILLPKKFSTYTLGCALECPAQQIVCQTSATILAMHSPVPFNELSSQAFSPGDLLRFS